MARPMASFFMLSMVLAAAPGAPSVTVVVDGPRAEPARAALAATSLPVELRLVAPPVGEAPSVPSTEWTTRLAAARSAWVSANFAACLAQLEGEGAEAELLARGERTLAARLLAWRAACHTGARHPEPARAAAEALAIFQAPLPDDVASMTPEVEALLAEAARDVAARKVEQRTLDSEPAGASVELDGRPVACTTPCVMDVLPGAHVVRMSADGFTPAWQVLARPDIRLTLQPASPELAGAQWRRRVERGDSRDGAAAVHLLSVSLRAPRLVVLTGDVAAPGLLRGALAIDGTVTVRAERDGDAEGLLRDLLERGRVVEAPVPLYQRWPFWLAVGAAVAAGATTAAVLITRDPTTRVTLGFQ